MSEITSYKFTIQPQDVDFTLRSSASSLINYMLNVAGEDAHNKGFGVEVLQEQSVTWVLSRMAVEIDLRPEQYSDIDIETWVNEFNRLTTTRNFRVRGREGVMASGVSQWCMLNMESRQAVDMTPLKSIYERAMVDEPSPIAPPARLRPAAVEVVRSRKVMYSDIDFNRHMNTLRYIDLMFDTLPLDLIENGACMRLDVHFLAEARYGEQLNIGMLQQDNRFCFEITTEDKTLCRASIEFR